MMELNGETYLQLEAPFITYKKTFVDRKLVKFSAKTKKSLLNETGYTIEEALK